MKMRPRAAATPISFVRSILLAYEKYGVNPYPALERAGVPRRLLGQERARVTAEQIETLAATAMQELDDEALGWFSRKLPWGTMGMLCRASLTSPSLGVALKRWCRHHRSLTEDILLSLKVERGTASLAIEERTALGAFREFCLMTTLRNVHGYGCWLVDSRIPLRQVSLPFQAPAHAEVYPLIFPGTVRFAARQATLEFDSQYLEMPVRRDERALRSMLKRALSLTILQYRRDRLLVQRVRDAVRRSAARTASAETIAVALNVSVRSLHRHLKEEGASLQKLKDETRCEQAVEQLCRTRKPIKQIARLAGFRNEKSFARAFREWTGSSPSDYRRREVEAG